MTRKPSQDSNLSSSRNDSSAASNSTATWRLSRSSVSSDAASHSGGGKSSLKRTIAATAAATHSYANTARAVAAPVLAPAPKKGIGAGGGSIHGQHGGGIKAKVLSFQETPVVASTSTQGQDKPEEVVLLEVDEQSISGQSVKSSQPKRQTVRIQTPAVSSTKPKIEEDGAAIIEDDELSAKIATNRPRLVRQSAFFSDEVVIEPEVCPVHGSLIPGTYDNEEEDQVSDIDEGEEEDFENADPTNPILKAAANPYSIAYVIVPRRLSTISSRESGTQLQVEDDHNPVTKWSGLGPAAAAMIASSPTTSPGAAARQDNSAPVPVSETSEQAGSSSDTDPNRRKPSDQSSEFCVLPTYVFHT